MFGKLKKIFKSDDVIELKPIVNDNTFKIAFYVNGQEIAWDSLSQKDKEKYTKQLNEKYSNMQVPLSAYIPKVSPKETIEEYIYPFANNLLIDALNDWLKCPESHPAIEKWYQDGCPEVKRPKTQDEISFSEYFPIFEKARELKNHDPLAALEKYVYILNNYKPTGTSYYTEPAELFCKLCRYDEAIFCLGRAKENIEVFSESTQLAILNEIPDLIEDIHCQKEIFEKILKVVNSKPGIIQCEVYKEINVNGNKARFVIYNMDYSGFVKRKKYKNSYRLFPTNKVIDKNYLIGF